MEEKDPEEWKDIIGFEGLYKISNYGNVLSLGRVIKYSNGFSRIQKDWMLSIIPTASHGYPNVNLYKDEKAHLTLVHRLVALHFIENDDPQNKTDVNHKFGVRTDNYYKHLEWCTHQQNMQHAIDTGLNNCKGSNASNAKSVINCRGQVFGSIIEAGEAFGLSNVSRIGDVCRGERNSSGKYPDTKQAIKWKYYLKED